MSLNLATFNVRGIRCRSKAARVVRDLVSLKVDIAAIQETHFVCDGDCQVMVNDYDVYSAYGNTYSRGISLLVSRTLSASVNVVHAGEDGRRLLLMLPLIAVRFSDCRCLCSQFCCREGILFSTVGGLLSGSGTVSSNG